MIDSAQKCEHVEPAMWILANGDAMQWCDACGGIRALDNLGSVGCRKGSWVLPRGRKPCPDG